MNKTKNSNEELNKLLKLNEKNRKGIQNQINIQMKKIKILVSENKLKKSKKKNNSRTTTNSTKSTNSTNSRNSRNSINTTNSRNYNEVTL